MCLGIPGRVTEIRDEAGLAMGRVDFGGLRKDACLAYLPEVRVGDYVIVHVGFAISRVDEVEALRTLEMLDRMGVIAPELMTMGPGMSEPALVSDDDADASALAPAPSPPASGGSTS
jgi:hydrogenase expression/formation protein HypC